MLANSREELVEAFDALDAELDRLDEVSFEVLTSPERLAMLERLEGLVRRLPAVGHALINQLDAQASEEELGGTLCCALANRLRITKPEAARRIADAADLGPRRALTGEPLAPQLTATATAQPPTTDSPKKAGSPAKTPTATPNGSHHPTSTTANPAPTPFITPRSCSTTTTTNPIDASPAVKADAPVAGFGPGGSGSTGNCWPPPPPTTRCAGSPPAPARAHRPRRSAARPR